MDSRTIKSEKPKGIRRRDFLAIGSAGVLATVLPRRNLLAWAVEAEDSPLVSVGYALGIAPGENLKENSGLSLNLVAAESMAAGDATFARRGARVGVRLLSPPEESKLLQRCEAFSILIDYGPYSDALFPVLDYENKGVANFGLAVDQTVPIDADTGLRLVVGIQEKNAQPRQSRIEFTLGVESGRPRLQRGTYLIAVGETARTVDWSQVRLQVEEADPALEGKPEYQLTTSASGAAEPEFMVLEVDYSSKKYVRQNSGGLWIVQ